eukprot:1484616-Lingulodinium_polyedra.AAC.1
MGGRPRGGEPRPEADEGTGPPESEPTRRAKGAGEEPPAWRQAPPEAGGVTAPPAGEPVCRAG